MPSLSFALRLSSQPAISLHRLAQSPIAVFTGLLLWTCIIRLPFSFAGDGDEFFFALVAQRWLNGELPYGASFDVKPPGLFLIFAAVQTLFEPNLLTIKALEFVFVAFGAWALFDMVKRHEADPLKPHAAWWAGGLYPVYMLLFAGVNAANIILQLPFIIFGVSLALRATASDHPNLRLMLGSGLCLGAAIMIKQTAVFETLLVIMIIGFGQRFLLKRLAVFTAGVVAPFVGFCLYFSGHGLLQPMLDAVLVSAFHRTDANVLADYGSDTAELLTLHGALINCLQFSAALICLWVAGVFTGLRYRMISAHVDKQLLFTALIWMGLAMAAAVIARMLVNYYLLPAIPPMLIMASASLAYGFRFKPLQQVLVAAAVMIVPIFINRTDVFDLHPGAKYDYAANLQAAEQLKDMGLKAGDTVFIPNRGYSVYLASGGQPVSSYFHATHVLRHFNTPSVDPLADNLRHTPRFAVIAINGGRLDYATDDARQRIDLWLKQNYRLERTINGDKDTMLIYRRR